MFSRQNRYFAAAFIVASVVAVDGQESSLRPVLKRVGDYAAAFQRQLSNVVAEERYVQDVRYRNQLPGRFATDTHRELRSDLLLVRPAGTSQYIAFRDVFTVDGKPIRDRRERLTALFLSQSPSIEQINRESARYNIGNIDRTINTPTLALAFLLVDNQQRFDFASTGQRSPALIRSPAPEAGPFVIEYKEVRRPTLIRGARGLDLPVHGRFWIDSATGSVSMSELIAEDSSVRATIDVRYQRHDRIRVMVPAEMHERYEERRDGAIVEGDAVYGDLRQFQVETSERVGAAPDQARSAEAAPAPSAAGGDAPTNDGPARDVANGATRRMPGATPTNREEPTLPARVIPLDVPMDAAPVARLYVTATDRTGHVVLDLRATDFNVKEAGANARVVRAALETEPARVVLLIDNSDAAVGWIKSLRAAIRDFVESVPVEDPIALMTFGRQVDVRLAATSDRSVLRRAAASLSVDYGSGTVLIDALIEASNRFMRSNSGEWPVFVIVTADHDEISRQRQVEFNKFVRDIQQRQGRVYAVLFSEEHDLLTARVAADLAKNSDGARLTAASEAELAPALHEIARRLSAEQRSAALRYEVDYARTTEDANASIEIGTVREGVTLAASRKR